MPCQTALTQRLRLTHPIIQAPMAGGATTVELVAAVCEAGALGFIGAAILPPPQIIEVSRELRARTSRPFGINLFASLPGPDEPRDAGPALKLLSPFHAELGLPPPTVPVLADDPFNEQLAAVLECGASVFSFTFGILPANAIGALKARGMFLIGTATTVEEARALEATGIDAVVAQGSEAGAHRGTFAVDFDTAMVGAMALAPQVAHAVTTPVIASGGIMDGRGIAAALALGASAVQMGTAFLTCDEAGIPQAHKEAILKAREDETRLTQAFSGRPARGIVNRLMTEIDRAGSEAILPYPLQNALNRAARERDRGGRSSAGIGSISALGGRRWM